MQIDLYNYKNRDFTCENCGWKGKGYQLELGEVFMDSAIVEYDCPKCYQKVAYGQGNIVDEEALLKFEKSKINDQKKVFALGGEGGSIAIYSNHNEETGTHWYYFEVNDMGFEEEDIPPSCRKSELSYTFWESLMRLRLEKPYFCRLYPLLVEKDFRDDVISVLRLLNDNGDFKLNYNSWSDVLDISEENLRNLLYYNK